jgi:exopolysaccharide biosynthesis protein
MVHDLPVRSHRRRSAAPVVAALSLLAIGIWLPPPARGAAPSPVAAGPASALTNPVPRPSTFDYGPGPLPVPVPVPAPVQSPPLVRPHNGVAARLPLGSAELKETRSVTSIAKGVTLTTIKRGAPLPKHKRGQAKTGPWVVRELTIDPSVAQGHLATTFGSSVAGTTPTTTLTRQADALVGVNASYFSIGSKLPGIPVGLTVSDGRVLSDPSGMGREVTLLVDTARNELHIDKLHWAGRLVGADGTRTLGLDKVNAAPRGHSQITAFTPKFGKHTPRGKGTEVVLDRHGCAVHVQSHRGATLGHGRSSIQATGAAAHKLRAMVKDGCIDVQSKLRDTKGAPIDLHPSVSAVTGRFQLLNEGRVVAPTRHGAFFARHPRTVAGTTWDGKIVFLTIDGGTRHSIGATLPQAARVARALGMREAVNLDGGGSTTMAIRGKLANQVSGGRERAVSDALVWVRRR